MSDTLRQKDREVERVITENSEWYIKRQQREEKGITSEDSENTLRHNKEV